MLPTVSSKPSGVGGLPQTPDPTYDPKYPTPPRRSGPSFLANPAKVRRLVRSSKTPKAEKSTGKSGKSGGSSKSGKYYYDDDHFGKSYKGSDPYNSLFGTGGYTLVEPNGSTDGRIRSWGVVSGMLAVLLLPLVM